MAKKCLLCARVYLDSERGGNWKTKEKNEYTSAVTDLVLGHLERKEKRNLNEYKASKSNALTKNYSQITAKPDFCRTKNGQVRQKLREKESQEEIKE